jgi:hypothetical protein
VKKSAIQRFDEFLYTPVDPLPIGLFRIAFGIVLLFRFITLCLEFNPLFTPDSFVAWEVARSFGQSVTGETVPYYRWSLFGISDTTLWARLLFIGYGISILAFLVGWRTKVAAFLVFVLTVSIHRREPILWTGGDLVIQCFAFWLLFVPAGAALSLDACRRAQRGGSPQVARAWGLLLLQSQVALIYFSTFLLKLFEAPAWTNGTAMAETWRLPFYARPWSHVLLGVPGLAEAATWGTMVFEIAFPLLIWSPRFRPWLLWFGVAFHLAIELTMRTGTFTWAMLAAYIPFLTASSLHHWVGDALYRRISMRCGPAKP